jgi:hypothetical protein
MMPRSVFLGGLVVWVCQVRLGVQIRDDALATQLQRKPLQKSHQSTLGDRANEAYSAGGVDKTKVDAAASSANGVAKLSVR